MIQEERFNNIVNSIRTKGAMTFKEIADLNGVSTDTARRDVDTLSEYGVIEKIRGGARWRGEELERHVYEMRNTINLEAKKELSGLITKIVKDGQTIAIGSGSTTVQIAKEIEKEYDRLMIITNDIDVVNHLSKKKHFKTILLGGFLDVDENCTYGDDCEHELEKYNVDVSILAVNSISLDKGITDFRLNQINLMKKLIDIGDKVVVASDHTKFEQRPACVSLCNLEEIDYILSDSQLNEKTKERLKEKGIRVITP